MGFVMGLHILVGHLHGPGDEASGDELDGLDHAPLDHVVVLVHAERERFAVEGLLADVVVDEQLQLLIGQAVEPLGGDARLEGAGPELNEGQKRLAIYFDDLAA